MIITTTGVYGYHKRCVNYNSRMSEALREFSLGFGKGLECTGKFHYLGDTVGAGGGAEKT